MAAKRASSRGGISSAPAPLQHSPWLTATLVGSALSFGIWTLVGAGKVHWPPTQLIAAGFTVAGSLALIGPLLLGRKAAGEFGVGDLIWMVGGLLIWIFDGAAVARGEVRTLAWATPLGPQTMGLIVLAVGLAAWRCRLGGGQWTWTNVIGWVLGLFWVALATAALLPTRTSGLAIR